MSDAAALQVIILRDGLLVGTEAFVPGSYVLGSGADADLRLDDPTVSASHAVLFFQNGRAGIQQTEGALHVNGHPVKACEVRPVDEIAIGPFTLKLRLLSKRATAPKPAPAPELARVFAQPPGAAQPPVRSAGTPAGPGVQTAIARPNVTPKPGTPAPAPTVVRPPTAPMRAAARPGAPISPKALAPVAMPARAAPAQPPAPARHAPAAPLSNGTLVFGRAPAEVHAALTTPGTPPPTRGGAAPAFIPAEAPLPAPIPAATLPSARRGGSGPKRTESLEIAVDSGPFHALPSAGFQVPREGRKGAPRLFIELFWKDSRQTSIAFGPTKKKPHAIKLTHPLQPFFGEVPEKEGFEFIESEGERYRLKLPSGAQVEKLREGGRFTQAAANELESGPNGKALWLSTGMAARLVKGPLSLRVYVAPPPERFFGNPLKSVPWLAMVLLMIFGGGVLWFALHAPQDPELPDFVPRDLAPVAVQLIRPQKKKHKPKPKIAEKAEKKEPEKKPEPKHERPHPKVAKAPPKVQPPAAPESAALKALKKLAAAGPAMKDVLAAVDKLGSGPGAKSAKAVNYKLSGMIGKAPIAAAGLGRFGLGGGGRGGIRTLGAELLRGKGGGGIGAMGIGNVGHGKVAGTVGRAVARNVGARGGSIDRDAVAKVVNQHLQEVRGCYERALLHDPGLAGKVVLEWTISTSGVVVSARTKTSTLHSPSVEACILSNLKGWRFPHARGGLVIVSYPFLFNSVGY